MRPEVYWVGPVERGRLAIVPRPRGGDWLADEMQALHDGGIDVLVCLLGPDEMAELELTDEPDVAQATGLDFVSLPIGDRGIPASMEPTRRALEQVRAELAAGRNVAVHCRMSIGRAPLIAASLLVLTGTAPAEAWRRVREARGTSVPDTAAQWAWVEEFARFARGPGTQQTHAPRGSS